MPYWFPEVRVMEPDRTRSYVPAEEVTSEPETAEPPT